MNKKILILFGLLGLAHSLVAQQHFCGQQEYLKLLEEENPGVNRAIENTFFDALTISKQKQKTTNDTIYKVNVVFHIVYNNDRQNIDDSLIYSQLRVMNEAFRRTNADTVNTRDVFVPFAADARMEFVMASEDPDGNPSNGIVRKQTVRQTFGSFPTSIRSADLVKNGNVGSAAWDTDKYLNIWICDLSVNGRDALLGYAYPPTGAGNWAGSGSFADSSRQGVVCHYKVIGVGNPESLATGEKTMVHEIGHYLGLRHIWGDGGCNVDDFMDDTPRARRASNGCNKGVNTCAELVGEQLPDMLENYMDYSTSDCQNMFTNEQVAQMRTNLTFFRSGIYTVELPDEPIILVEANELDKTGIYPNPATEGKVTVYLKDFEVDQDYDFRIYTLLGQPVYEWQLEAKLRQEVGGMLGLQGMYIYRITKEDVPIAAGRIMMGER